MKTLQVVLSTVGRHDILSSIAIGLGAEEHDVEFASFDEGTGDFASLLRRHGVVLHALGLGSTLRSVVRLRRLLRGTEAAVVQAHGHHASLLLVLSMLGLRGGPASMPIRHHNLSHHLIRSRLRVLLDRFIIHRADGVVVTSTSVRESLIAEGCPLDRLYFATNGRDWDDVGLDRNRVIEIRGSCQHEFLLVAVGNLKFEKDYPTLIRAVREVVDRGTDVELQIAGVGADQDRTQLEALVSELDLADHVRFLGWVEEALTLIAAADLFVHSAIDETGPQVVYEAAGLGVPVVATSAGGITDILGRHYELVDPGDPVGLAETVLRCLSELDANRRRAESIAVDIRKRYGSARCRESYLRACSDLLRDMDARVDPSREG